MNPLFSVIIPAYNAENHIRKGLDSIKAQTFKGYELIVVCDRCTDNTEQIAKEYGAITECVDFGRDGLTRDKGLETATGRYILFMDDDDWFLHEYCFQSLADEICSRSFELDALAFGYIFKSRGYIKPKIGDVFRPTVGHVWSVCWRRDLTVGAKFGDAVFSSDTYFLRDMSKRVQHLEVLDNALYYYNFNRPGSQTDLFIQGKLRSSPEAR